MTQGTRDSRTARIPFEGISGFLHFAGLRYWSASLLPALVGTTLPFWLQPPGFSFRWLDAIAFLVAAVLLHAGFSFLQAWFERRNASQEPKSGLLCYAGTCIVAACLLGLYLNSGLHLHKGVYESIFIVFGLSTIFAGVLYVVPPFKLRLRVGGEVIIAYSLGMLPVLGAYLVQVGDITRKVYLAGLPLVVATGLWVWVKDLASRRDDEEAGRETMVLLFGPCWAGRLVVLALSFLLYATLLGAAFTASLPLPALIALLSIGLVWKIGVVSWNGYAYPDQMLAVRKYAFVLHFITCSIIAASSLIAQLI